ncbi:hypothetical protein ACN9MD_09160 [Stenotrophomonas maltophilia]|mgnify:FL=1|jgi:hypothetical protein|uniref:hypothetical protein n=1 Tax=Stenotrophomonas TaxID=40323 RepID=UPI00062DA811|nr:hypothetical protein [Stenotrophomonas maltophilia]TIE21104.1 hypothetical protein DI034_02690 [Stenotrophomonas maltophilia]TIE64385.1 hypothetical protein DI041_03440 [Stenotrophomonas maltophilia]HEL2957907.1 hypothetical protein [Stenotrophomonas maltophilia]HEL7749370.1 hypothetical protein [Stenotrophomonas maltophilia]
MFQKTGRAALLLGAALQVLVLLPYAGQAHAQNRDGYRSGWDRGYQDRQRDEWERRERERERDRRDDAKAKRVVVGVVGAAVVAGVIAAAAKREREVRERADYCMSRYGNYDRRSDTYRGSDGYSYPCR